MTLDAALEILANLLPEDDEEAHEAYDVVINAFNEAEEHDSFYEDNSEVGC